WTIAVEDEREKGTAGALRLPKLALDIFAKLPRISGNPYVFASGEHKHFNSWSERKQELDERLIATDIKMDPWVIHDLRRSARSLMSRAGVSSEHAERVLGHAIMGVEGVYNRFEFFDEKAAALAKLATLVKGIVQP